MAIARAIVVKPSLILADEPVSMLDVSVRAGVLNLLANLRDELHATILMITHDLAVARYLAERIVIFHAGRIVEAGPTEEVLSNPQHPYTSLLVSASPRLRPGRVRGRRKQNSFSVDAEGCQFAPRCPEVTNECLVERPNLVAVAKDHLCACHRRVTERW